jgi:hypothetical protein
MFCIRQFSGQDNLTRFQGNTLPENGLFAGNKIEIFGLVLSCSAWIYVSRDRNLWPKNPYFNPHYCSQCNDCHRNYDRKCEAGCVKSTVQQKILYLCVIPERWVKSIYLGVRELIQCVTHYDFVWNGLQLWDHNSSLQIRSKLEIHKFSFRPTFDSPLTPPLKYFLKLRLQKGLHP